MPHNLAIGVSKYDFFHSSPKELKAYLDAWTLKRKMQDERDWMLGRYFFDAISISLHNAFLKKGGKRMQYNDESYLRKAETQKKYETGEGLTEEEKKAATDFLFASLSVMQANFENSQRAKQLGPQA